MHRNFYNNNLLKIMINKFACLVNNKNKALKNSIKNIFFKILKDKIIK